MTLHENEDGSVTAHPDKFTKWLLGIIAGLIAAGVIGLITMKVDGAVMQSQILSLKDEVRELKASLTDAARDRYHGADAARDLAIRDGRIAALENRYDALTARMREAEREIASRPKEP